MIGASLGQGLGVENSRKKRIRPGKILFRYRKKQKKKRKNVERNKKRRKTPQYNRNIQNFQKSRITIKLLNVNDKIGERKFEGYKKKKGMERFLYISFTFFNYSRRIILLSHIYFLYLRLFICLPSASILRQRSKSLVGLL